MKKMFASDIFGGGQCTIKWGSEHPDSGRGSNSDPAQSKPKGWWRQKWDSLRATVAEAAPFMKNIAGIFLSFCGAVIGAIQVRNAYRADPT